MNFKALFFSFLLLVGCGVAGPPVAPEDSQLPDPTEPYREKKNKGAEQREEQDQQQDGES